YFNAAGQPVAEAVSARALSPTLDHLRASRVVALAGGADKVSPILALLRSEFLDGLVTDEVTARAILAENAAA
ncbi:MAG: sugar-binding domain-containing protein, partial [Aurantimonas coralicida]